MRHLQERDPVQVTLERGMLRLRRGNPQAEGLYDLDTTNALRAFFQAERDTKLGRWRDTENTDMVAYRTPEEDDDDGRCILLLNEHSGEFWLDWERLAYSGPARRYFDAHPQPEPEPRPWEDAKPGEVWVLTRWGTAEPFLVTGGEFITADLAVIVDLDDDSITAGHRIWPEPRIGGAE